MISAAASFSARRLAERRCTWGWRAASLRSWSSSGPVRRTSASRASLLMGTEPLWAVAAGVVVAGETLGWLGALGAS